jgi:tRNA (guanine6-N2)-methyltransferase
MSRPRSEPALPACYAMVQPGLETVAADEIERDLGGVVKKTSPGFVVFRVPEIDERLLQLRTVEDVFLFAWGTDQLTHRAEDLDKIERWTAREPDWNHLLRLHHAIRPKPKGKPTYHLVTQKDGEHAYLRREARKSLARGLVKVFPPSWREAEEEAAVEVWLSIDGQTALCGLRLSDRTMRHRTYKLEHRPASLRPTIAAAMVRLAEFRPRQTILDPMCGAGTILAEYLGLARTWRGVNTPPALGGDLEFPAIRATSANLRRLGPSLLCCWDAGRLPLPDAAVDRIVCNPPFGKQLSDPAAIGPLYRRMLPAFDRVLKPGGNAVLLVSDVGALRSAVRPVGWKSVRELRVRVLGQPAVLSVWRKDV